VEDHCAAIVRRRTVRRSRSNAQNPEGQCPHPPREDARRHPTTNVGGECTWRLDLASPHNGRGRRAVTLSVDQGSALWVNRGIAITPAPAKVLLYGQQLLLASPYPFPKQHRGTACDCKTFDR